MIVISNGKGCFGTTAVGCRVPLLHACKFWKVLPVENTGVDSDGSSFVCRSGMPARDFAPDFSAFDSAVNIPFSVCMSPIAFKTSIIPQFLI